MKVFKKQVNNKRKKVILHLITTLERGGAQKILSEISNPELLKTFSQVIICLSEKTDFSKVLTSKGYLIYHLNGKSIVETPIIFFKLLKLIKKFKPQIIQTWLYHCDFLGSLIKIIYPQIKLVWSIHHASKSLNNESFHTKILFRILIVMSKFIPDKIIFCSKFSYDVHKKVGYALKKSFVINNGIDLDYFKPNKKLRDNFRAKLSIKENQFIIGMAARFDPNKGIDTFLDIIQSLEKISFQSTFVICGHNINAKNIDLKKMIYKRKLNGKIILLGEFKETNIFFNSIDLLICPSRTESFGLVVLEALSCGTPVFCSKLKALENLVGHNNVVKNNDIETYVNKIIKYRSKFDYGNERKPLRENILKSYNIVNMISRYNEIYLELTNLN